MDHELTSCLPAGGVLQRAMRGFTLVELVVVLVLTGILGGIAASRFFDKAGFDADQFTDQLRSMVRYAQKVAIAQQRPVFVRLGGGGIALCFDSGCTAGNRVSAPAGNNSGSALTANYCNVDAIWHCEATPSDVTVSVSVPYTLSGGASGNATLFGFDALGKPFVNAVNSAELTSNLPIVVTGDGAPRNTIVEMETGYVH